MLGPPLSPLPAWGVPEVLPPTLPAITGRHQPYTHVFPTVSPALMLCGRGGDQQGLRAAVVRSVHMSLLVSAVHRDAQGNIWVLSQAGETSSCPGGRWERPRSTPGPQEGGCGPAPRTAARGSTWKGAEVRAPQALPRSGSSPTRAMTSGSPGDAGSPLGLRLLVSRGRGGEVTCSKSLLRVLLMVISAQTLAE